MGSLPLECTIVCTKCEIIAYSVYRKPATEPGVMKTSAILNLLRAMLMTV
jgi:hypothetical protein